jgi:hypothetical protein
LCRIGAWKTVRGDGGFASPIFVRTLQVKIHHRNPVQSYKPSKVIVISAVITLERAPELGLRDRIKSGLRPSFNYEGQLVACIVEVADGSDWIEIGSRQRVTIRLPYADQFGWNFRSGTHFRLNVGGKVIGVGTVS